MSELKPCPFCGNDKGIKYVNDFYGLWVFWCPSCHAQTASQDDWNTRPIEDALRAEIDRLKSEHLLWTKGGEGSHWEGCEDVHWDCRIAQLEAELARRDEELALTEKKLCNIDRSARAEVARRDEELKITDGLLKEATETIGAVIACCTYNSNDDAKIGVYGIDQNAFTKIDQFITRYNDAVSAGKVSVDVKPVNREKDYQNYNRTNTGG